jgi:TolA-binding protein
MCFQTKKFLLRQIIFFSITVGIQAQGLQDEKESFNLAQRLFDDRDYANAAQEFSRFFENYPTSDRLPTALLRLGQSYYNGEDYERAIEASQKFVDQYPKRLEVATTMRRKAESLQMLGKHVKAGLAYQEVHDGYMGGEYAPQDLLSAGYNFHKGRELDAAETAFRTLISQHPESPLYHEATFNLGLVLLEADLLEEALSQFKAIADYGEPTERKPDALLEIGKVALYSEDLPEADRIFSELRRSFPNSSSAQTSYLVVASWYASSENWQEAENVYRLARENLPRSENRQLAVLGLAHATRKMGKSKEALDLYTQFLDVYGNSPHQARAWLGLGRSSADLGDFRSALNAFHRLQEEYPETDSSIEAYSDVGDVWRELGTPRKALLAYETYKDRVQGPQAQASALLRIGLTYENDLAWYDLASETYGGVVAKAPPQYASEGQFGIARTFERTSQPNLAIREYSRYIQNYPDGQRAGEAETRIKFLREFPPDVNSTIANSLVDLISKLPGISNSPKSKFHLGKYLAKSSRHQLATELLTASLTSDSLEAYAPEATFLLGESWIALSRKAELQSQGTEARALLNMGLKSHRNVVEKYTSSQWSENAIISIAEEEARHIFSDSTRAQFILNTYLDFEESYPQSTRRQFATLRIADAHRILGKIQPSHIEAALQGYLKITKSDAKVAIKERASLGVGLCQAMAMDHVSAEETLRAFLFDHPGSSLTDKAQYELGRILLERGFFRGAADELSELLVSPSSLELEKASRSLLSESYFRLGEFKKTIQIDEGLLRRRLNAPLLRRLARAYQEDKRPDLAVKTYSTFLRNFPDASDADSIAFIRAELLSYMGRSSEAVSAFKDFAEQFPVSPLRNEANRTVADLLFATGDYKSALSIYRKIPSQSRRESVAGHEVLCLFRLNKIKEAKETASQFKKKHRESMNWLARFRIEEGKYELGAGRYNKARGIFDNVIKKYSLQEAKSEASYYRSQALKKEGNHEDYLVALGAFVKNHTESPNWTVATLELADLYFEGEDFARASRAFQQALERGVSEQNRPTVLLKLMKVHKNQKFFDTAIAYARRFVAKYPRHKQAIDTRMEIGNMLQSKGNHQEAIKETMPLLKVVKGDDWSSVQHDIARSYFALKDYESATREFLKMQYQFQGSANWLASAHYGLADCYEARGDYGEAMQELEEIQRRFGPTSNFGVTAGERIRRIQSLIGSVPQFSTPGRQE